MLNKLLLLVLLTSPTVAKLSAQDVGARFTADKSAYVIGEPVYVILSLSNRSNDPIWVDLGPTNIFCEHFLIEVPGADLAREQWGCGIGGSCGKGLSEVAPGKTTVVRQLLNREFRLQRPGTYVVRAETAVTVRREDLWSAPPFDELNVSDNLNIEVQASVEDQLQAAFRPFVEELSSADPSRRGEAAAAIIETAPPFLEDVLIELTKTNYGLAAMTALRKADTQKTRYALARIATDSTDRMFRIEAIRNLGRTGDSTYLPELFTLMKSTDPQIQGAAVEAAGNLGGAGAIQEIAVLVSSSDVQTRQAGANGLAYTHAREAVPILIGLLLDSNVTIRQTAVTGLSVLTRRAAFDGNQSGDVATPQAASNLRRRWEGWWKSQGSYIEIHGMGDCSTPDPLN